MLISNVILITHDFLFHFIDCRPVGDLGLNTGIIPDTSIKVSGVEAGYGKNVSIITVCNIAKFTENNYNAKIILICM